MSQVLVVGAGPVGLTMAAELIRYGVDVRVIDQVPQRSATSKALVLWSRTLELLDRPGCTQAFVDAGLRVDAVNIVASGKPLAHVGFQDVDSPHPYALMLPQSETERLLEAHLQDLGGHVERQVTLAAFTQPGATISARLRQADGREETIEADWLIGCDGAHSTVRHALGIPFQGDTLQSDWILADIHLTASDVPSNELSVFWHEDGVLALFPISPGRFRVIADLGPSTGSKPPTPTLDQIQTVLDRRGPGRLHATDPVWLSGFRINERKVADYRAGRVFLAGDAAHVHSPAGGQGMNTGMQDAFNLAWKLALVCAGRLAAPALLDSYSIERSAVGDQVLAAAGRLTTLAVLRNHTAQSLRNLVGSLLLGLAPVRRTIADTLAEVSIGYPATPLNGPHHRGSPAPGTRAPPRGAPFGAGRTPRFTLCSTPETGKRLLQRHPDLLDPDIRPPVHPAGACLIRPDGYVAATAKDDADTIDAYLTALRA